MGEKKCGKQKDGKINWGKKGEQDKSEIKNGGRKMIHEMKTVIGIAGLTVVQIFSINTGSIRA